MIISTLTRNRTTFQTYSFILVCSGRPTLLWLESARPRAPKEREEIVGNIEQNRTKSTKTQQGLKITSGIGHNCLFTPSIHTKKREKYQSTTSEDHRGLSLVILRKPEAITSPSTSRPGGHKSGWHFMSRREG